MKPISHEALAWWSDQLAKARQDAAWVEGNRALDTRREGVMREIRDLIEGFLSGARDVEGFRGTFDLKTRAEWDVFGFKANSGAMFLNKLVKHVPGREELTTRLRAVLRAPMSAEGPEPRARMQVFFDYLRSLITGGTVSANQIQPKRTPFLVSGLWHVQVPDPWPVFYESARGLLEDRQVYERTEDPIERYFRFREAFLLLSQQLQMMPWELEHLCVRAIGGDGAPPPLLPGPESPEPRRRRVWLIAPGPQASRWEAFYRDGLVAIGWDYLGDLQQYPTVEAIKEAMRAQRKDGTEPTQDALACWEFAHEMRPGDLLFAKKGRRLIVGHGVVTSDYEYDASRPDYRNVRRVSWQSNGSWTPRDRPLVMKALTDISGYSQLVAQIRAALGLDRGEVPVGPERGLPETECELPPYTVDHAAAEVFLARSRIEELFELLRHRRNVILQGPPGVGKTFVASRLAALVMGANDPERMAGVQFHQSYSYEDFVQGYRPSKTGGFNRQDGPLLRICDRALQDPESAYVLIIDEINRGNVSRVLGELLMLIEPDKRDRRWAIPLTYGDEGDEPFYVPSNLYLIGTMNTADRSLAMVDYALRRRFAFVDLAPDFDDPTLRAHLAQLGVDSSLETRIRRRLTALNDRIAQDPTLGRGFLIGHSYVCHVPPGVRLDEDWFERIVRFEIGPLLREYWFDRPDEAEEAIASLLADD